MKSTYSYRVASDYDQLSKDIICGSEVNGIKYNHKAVVEIVCEYLYNLFCSLPVYYRRLKNKYRWLLYENIFVKMSAIKYF